MEEATKSEEANGEVSGQRYFDRDLSWLEFNSRVLAQAEDPELRVLDRLKFCAIHASNLDEFFMVRYSHSKNLREGHPPELLAEIRRTIGTQVERAESVLNEEVGEALKFASIEIATWQTLSSDEAKQITNYFRQHIFPLLTPVVFDSAARFPYISGLVLNIAVALQDPTSGRQYFGKVQVPSLLDRFIRVGDQDSDEPGVKYISIEQIISAHLEELYPGNAISGGWTFRVTRDAGLELDGEADDVLQAIEHKLRQREFGDVVRLEVADTMPGPVKDLLTREFALSTSEVFASNAMPAAVDLWQIFAAGPVELKRLGTYGVVPARLDALESSTELFAEIAERDLLVHHPYEAFGASVAQFIDHAAHDEHVVVIKMTLYRTSGDSPLVEALLEAARQGKQVVVLVELKARFDEQANIGWARRLEEAGVHVSYGPINLKIHAKVALVVRREAGEIRRYCHVGTGNYNPSTAKYYEDIGLFTADPLVSDDLAQLFNSLTGLSQQVNYRKLLVAPHNLRSSIRRLIEAEMAAPNGRRIVMKMNSLVDRDMIELLYAAGTAGVKIDLIVRGSCCLVPQKPGLSENITVRSLVGHHLEHSRIYYFANGALAGLDNDPQLKNSGATKTSDSKTLGGETLGTKTLGGETLERYYVGSADLMPRNLDRRVETLIPVEDEQNTERLRSVLETALADTFIAWGLDDTGAYSRVTAEPGVTPAVESTHEALRLDETNER